METQLKDIELPASKLVKSQKKKAKGYYTDDNGDRIRVLCTLRYDDQCGNGHNTFSMTADLYNESELCSWGGGCCHDDIAKAFPKLRKFIKWHLTSSDGPMYYIANTTYHASDKDCWGLRKGEKKQLINGRTKNLSWELATLSGKPCRVPGIDRYVDSEKQPAPPEDGLQYIPWYRIGEGKEPNLEAARSCAVWEDATLEDLQNVQLLKQRLPGLMEEFKADMIELGFEY